MPLTSVVPVSFCVWETGPSLFLRTVERTEATAPLVDYADEVRRDPIVITARGRPVAFLAAVRGTDLESLSTSTDPGFLEVLRRSRDGHKMRGDSSIKRTHDQAADMRQKHRRRPRSR